MSDLRIFSYLPNPRLFKATITARLNGVSLEIRGAKPSELTDWLWDFDAHPLNETERTDPSTLRTARKGFKGGIHKTDGFLEAHPFGTVPAAFDPDGRIGIFESNSIMRAVARLGAARRELYGDGPYATARVDAFLDSSLVFAVESQRYLFALGGKGSLAAVHDDMTAAFEAYLGGIDTALAAGSPFLAGKTMTLADICFACELTLFGLERHEHDRLEHVGRGAIIGKSAHRAFPRAFEHFEKLMAEPAFAADLGRYRDEMTLATIFS
jgi:glutathione S-transferase